MSDSILDDASLDVQLYPTAFGRIVAFGVDVLILVLVFVLFYSWRTMSLYTLALCFYSFPYTKLGWKGNMEEP